MRTRATLAAVGCFLLLISQAWAGGAPPPDQNYGLAGAVTDILLAPCYLLFELAGGGAPACGPPRQCYVVCVPSKDVCRQPRKVGSGGPGQPPLPTASRTTIPGRASEPPQKLQAVVPGPQMTPAQPAPGKVQVQVQVTPLPQPKPQPAPNRGEVAVPQGTPPAEVQPLKPLPRPQPQVETPNRAPAAPTPPPPAATEIPKVQQPAAPVAPTPPTPAVPAVREQPPQTAPDKLAEPPTPAEPKTSTAPKPQPKRGSGKETPACWGYYPPPGCYPTPWCR